jgi:hypothetical protein
MFLIYNPENSWLQIQRSVFDSRRYQIFWEVVGLERSPLSFVGTIEELLERESRGSGLENRDYCRREPSPWSHDTLYPQKLALTLSTNDGRSVGVVRLRTKATEFSFIILKELNKNLYFLKKRGNIHIGISSYFQSWSLLLHTLLPYGIARDIGMINIDTIH